MCRQVLWEITPVTLSWLVCHCQLNAKSITLSEIKKHCYTSKAKQWLDHHRIPPSQVKMILFSTLTISMVQPATWRRPPNLNVQVHYTLNTVPWRWFSTAVSCLSRVMLTTVSQANEWASAVSLNLGCVPKEPFNAEWKATWEVCFPPILTHIPLWKAGVGCLWFLFSFGLLSITAPTLRVKVQ